MSYRRVVNPAALVVTGLVMVRAAHAQTTTLNAGFSGTVFGYATQHTGNGTSHGGAGPGLGGAFHVFLSRPNQASLQFEAGLMAFPGKLEVSRSSGGLFDGLGDCGCNGVGTLLSVRLALTSALTRSASQLYWGAGVGGYFPAGGLVAFPKDTPGMDLTLGWRRATPRGWFFLEGRLVAMSIHGSRGLMFPVSFGLTY